MHPAAPENGPACIQLSTRRVCAYENARFWLQTPDKHPAEAQAISCQKTHKLHVLRCCSLAHDLVFLCGARAHSENNPTNLTEKIEEYRSGAERGIAAYQVLLAHCYAEGDGVRKDNAEAVKWFRKAAEQGESYAQYMLGFGYANGVGVPKDEAEAAKLFRKAAEQGEARAQVLLAGYYHDGIGVTKDEADVSNELKQPYIQEEKFENVVNSAERAAVLILVY